MHCNGNCTTFRISTQLAVATRSWTLCPHVWAWVALMLPVVYRSPMLKHQADVQQLDAGARITCSRRM